MRLAVTDRCNLRCSYCMPACGIDFTSREQMLTYEEMLRISYILVNEGVKKIRITGGEPFVRKDLMDFLSELTSMEGLHQIHITTNGTLLEGKIDRLYDLGIRSINLSMDSLDSERFKYITRRDDLPIVLNNMRALIDHHFHVKINMVVMSQMNIDDIIPMLELSRNNKIDVRFLEEMPFNGTGRLPSENYWNHLDILNYVKSTYPDLEKIADSKNSTSMNYHIPGFAGNFGIIASYSRTFCGTCNRIRITPQGMLKTCLYDSGIFSVRDIMRAGASDLEILAAIKEALAHRARDGHEAENRNRELPISESMATIGG